jgi:hypothetical protein
MKLTKMLPAEVFSNLKCAKNRISHYWSSISGFISVGDFVYLSPATNLEHVGSRDDQFANQQMLKQFRSTMTFGQVTNLDDMKPRDQSSNEKDVFININVHLKRDALPTSLGHSNYPIPQGHMLVQTDLAIEGGLMEENAASLMVIHMNHYDMLMEGLLNIYFIDSVYHFISMCLMMKSSDLHVRSTSDLLRKAFIEFSSHPELQYNHLVKGSDAVYKMMCRVAASQPQTNCGRIIILTSVWLMINRYLLDGTKEKRLEIYYGNDVIVPTVKRGVFITPVKITYDRQRSITSLTG